MMVVGTPCSAGQRHRLGVVAGGIGDDPALALVGRERGDGVAGAAELEGAGALKIFRLEEQAGAAARIRRARGQHRRAMGDAVDTGCRRRDVGESRNAQARVPGAHDDIVIVIRHAKNPRESTYRFAPYGR